jgi:hypothetical protein
MSNFFKKVMSDAKGLEEEVLGPDYNYTDFIKSPEELGMSDNGSLDTLAHDVGGLLAYVELLASGNSAASKNNNQPLGDKFFLATGAKCKDIASGLEVTRSLYINNVPDGDIPFISSAMGGMDFKDFRGLVPGVIGNLSNINPLQIFQAFVSGSMPDCQAIEMETIIEENGTSQSTSKTAYVTNTDIQNMNPCWFPNKSNPVTNSNCKEAFKNRNENYNECLMPDDPYVKLYYSALAVFGLYIMLLLFNRKR